MSILLISDLEIGLWLELEHVLEHVLSYILSNHKVSTAREAFARVQWASQIHLTLKNLIHQPLLLLLVTPFLHVEVMVE